MKYSWRLIIAFNILFSIAVWSQVITVSATTSASDPAAMKVLQRVIQSERTLKMEGQRTTKIGKEPGLVENVYRSGRRLRVEYTAPASHKGEILIDCGMKAWFYQPSRGNWIEINSPRSRQHQEIMRNLRFEKWRVFIAGRAKIAGREADIIEFKDTAGRLVERMWVDLTSGLVLKREHYDSNGKLAGSSEFQRVNFNSNSPESLFAPPVAKLDFIFRQIEALKKAAPFQINEPASSALPSGIVFQEGRIGSINDKAFVAMHYAGGGHRITLMQSLGVTSLFPHKPMQGYGRMRGRGRMNTYFWKSDDRTYGLIGDLSEDDLKKIADTVAKR